MYKQHKTSFVHVNSGIVNINEIRNLKTLHISMFSMFERIYLAWQSLVFFVLGWEGGRGGIDILFVFCRGKCSVGRYCGGQCWVGVRLLITSCTYSIKIAMFAVIL